MPLKVSVVGDRKTGKTTFLKSLVQDSNAETYNLSVSDIKNNVQTVYQFRKVDLGIEAADSPWLKESVCVIMLFDIS